MTITISRPESAGDIIRDAAAAGDASLNSVDERFLSALKKSLAEVGLEDLEVHVTLNEPAAAAEDTTGASSAGEGSPGPVSPFHWAAFAPWRNAAAAASTTVPQGPQITNDMWTEELLTGDLTDEMLRDVKDPAGLLRARLDAVKHTTTTNIESVYDGISQGVNPAIMSTREQAEAMLDRLKALGLADGQIDDFIPVGGMFKVNFAEDGYRFFMINGLNVGLLVERYAKNTVEMADAMTQEELNAMSAAQAT